MLLYRVKQFYRVIISKIEDDDIIYINNKLNSKELNLFRQLKVSEQKHCINVAKDIEKECFKRHINSDKLVKVALLHDIGKIYRPMSLIEKSLMVMLHYVSKGKIKRLNKIEMVNAYYNHGEKGAAKLSELNYYDKNFLYLIKNHHNSDIVDDDELNILKEFDNKN